MLISGKDCYFLTPNNCSPWSSQIQDSWLNMKAWDPGRPLMGTWSLCAETFCIAVRFENSKQAFHMCSKERLLFGG
eukprot:5793483-Karenia_brevis.AAC.1